MLDLVPQLDIMFALVLMSVAGLAGFIIGVIIGKPLAHCKWLRSAKLKCNIRHAEKIYKVSEVNDFGDTTCHEDQERRFLKCDL